MARRFKKSAGIQGVFGNVRTSKTTLAKYSGIITVGEIKKKFGIPDDAEVYVRVPGGADWSNMKLDLLEAPIQVQWERVE